LASVLVVGKGEPEHGGIPSFIDMTLRSQLRTLHRLDFLNLTHASEPHGGRATFANLTRTVHDAVAVWRSSRGRDIVHLHTALAPGVTALRAGLLAVAARARGCQVLIHVHGGRLPLWARRSRHRILLRVALAPANIVVAVSESVAETLRGVARRQGVEVLDNGVCVETFMPSSRTAPRPGCCVLYVGLLTPRKGVLDLLGASAMLRSDGVAHELSLVGGTPDEGPEAEAEVHQKLTDHVRLRGTVEHEEMPVVYSDADVFCLPSWYEAMPLSVLEAMASGLPVVATDVGDVARLVVDGETGFLVEPRRPEQLADALARLVGDPALRARMGAAGRARVTNQFSSDAVIGRLSEIYGELGRTPR
jgi:glycosyltransferase involved in cell wall biosynthesis